MNDDGASPAAMILRVVFSRRKKNFEIESIHLATQQHMHVCIGKSFIAIIFEFYSKRIVQ